MTVQTTREAPAPTARRRRHWLRWILVGVVAVVVLLLGVVAVAVKLQPTPAPLTLPPAAAAPAGPIDGTYQVSSGSVAGFRVKQTVLLLTSDVVGRTNDVTGTVTVAGARATTANVRVNLLALTSNGGKPAPQFDTSLDTQRYPVATVGLAQPVPLDALGSGSTTISATGTLSLHGVTRTVTVPLTLRRDGANLDIAGRVPVSFADYGLSRPSGAGPLGSLADHGVAEFLLILRHG